MRYRYVFTVRRIIYILKLVVSILLALFYADMLIRSIFEIIISDINYEYPSFGYITIWCGSIFLSALLIKKIGVLRIPKDAYMVPVMIYALSIIMKLMSMDVI